MDTLESARRACTKCGAVTPLEYFDVRADTGRQRSYCKSCRRAYQRERLQCSDPARTASLRIIGRGEAFLCTRCVEALPAAAFPPKARGSSRLQSWCRACFARYNAARYAANRESEILRLRRNRVRARAASRQRLFEYLSEHPCVDCGLADTEVLEFDHLRDKRVDVSVMVQRGSSWRAVLDEIAKCEVRCANCHRRKTGERRRAVKMLRDPGGNRTLAFGSVDRCSIR